MSESEKQKVPFSVRFDPDLFDSLETNLNRIPRKERPTKDQFIQQAVAAYIEGFIEGYTFGAPTGTPLGSSTTPPEQTTPPKVQSINLSEAELKWLEQILARLRAGAALTFEATRGPHSRDAAREARGRVSSEPKRLVDGSISVIRGAEETTGNTGKDRKKAARDGDKTG